MLVKRPKHRVFDYPPRFYKPTKDELNKKRRKVQFNSVRKFQRRKKNTVVWAVFVLLVIYIYLKLSGIL